MSKYQHSTTWTKIRSTLYTELYWSEVWAVHASVQQLVTTETRRSASPLNRPMMFLVLRRAVQAVQSSLARGEP